MSSRLSKLKDDVKKQADYVSTLVFDENEQPKNNQQSSTSASLKPPTWEELQAVTNAIQPKYTGKTGLATFTAQKVLTIDRLKVNM